MGSMRTSGCFAAGRTTRYKCALRVGSMGTWVLRSGSGHSDIAESLAYSDVRVEGCDAIRGVHGPLQLSQ